MIAVMKQPQNGHHLPKVNGPEGEAGLLKTVSASRLNCFHQCRLKYFFQYVEKIEKAPTAALHVGKTVHAVLQEWNLGRWKGEPLSEEQLKEFFVQSWDEEQLASSLPINWGEKELAEKDSAWAVVQAYLQQTPIPLDEKPMAVEVRVEADLAAKGLPVLVGVLDLVRKGGCIVDFKTTGQTPSQEKVIHQIETQLSCYAILYRDAVGEKENGFEIHHLVKLKTPKVIVTAMPPVTKDQEKRLFHLMGSFVAGVQRKDWVPSPGMACASCQFFHECRRWS